MEVYNVEAAWNQDSDPIPNSPIAYAVYNTKGTYSDIGLTVGTAVAGYTRTFGSIGAGAEASVTSVDTISIVINTLSAGSEVNVRLRYFLTGTQGASVDRAYAVSTGSALTGYISLTNQGSSVLFENFCVATFDCGNGVYSSVFGITLDTELYLRVGAEYELISSIQGGSGSSLSFYNDGAPSTLHGGSTHLRSFNSLHTYLTPTSDDFYIETESGHNYTFTAASVPEPGTCALMLAGLGTVWLTARRRKSLSH